jgi:hypothetical protein
VQTIGGCFIFLGVLFILAHKAEYKDTVIPHTLHSITGTIVVALIILQVVIGNQKVAQMERTNTKIRRWHGDLGLLLWDLLCITVLTGMFELFIFNVLHLFVEAILLALWLAVHVQIRRKSADKSVASDEEVDVDGTAVSGERGGGGAGESAPLSADVDKSSGSDDFDFNDAEAGRRL